MPLSTNRTHSAPHGSSCTKSSQPFKPRPNCTWASQHHEDLVLLPLLLYAALPGWRGSFVELGALDGVMFSNTYALEQCYGWGGVLIEAAPDNFVKLSASGRKSARVHAAVCDEHTGTVPISRTGSKGWGAGDLQDMSKEHLARFDLLHLRMLSASLYSACSSSVDSNCEDDISS